mmetsp:Transcript_19728/g.59745  ORF Transcript_19728/g.59745 Transcript_19728/m.59745 type:complete len:371 (+) Transcript_19728:118-1230(+)
MHCTRSVNNSLYKARHTKIITKHTRNDVNNLGRLHRHGHVGGRRRRRRVHRHGRRSAAAARARRQRVHERLVEELAAVAHVVVILEAARGVGQGVHVHVFEGDGVELEVLADDDGLRRREQVVREPVDAEAGRRVRGEPRDDERQELQDPLRALHRLVAVLGRRREDAHGHALGDEEHRRQDEVQERVVPAQRRHVVHPALREPVQRVPRLVAELRPVEVRHPEEGLLELVQPGEAQQRAVERDEEWDLHERREAARERVHLRLREERREHLLLLRLVVRELLLDGLLQRAQRLDLLGTLELLKVHRDEQRLEARRENHDGPAVRLVHAALLQEPVQAHHARLDEAPERAPARQTEARVRGHRRRLVRRL